VAEDHGDDARGPEEVDDAVPGRRRAGDDVVEPDRLTHLSHPPGLHLLRWDTRVNMRAILPMGGWLA